MGHEVIQYFSPDQLECELQIREQFSDRELIGLGRSLQEIGFQQPVRARRDGGRLVVVVGERRLRAARLAKLREIPVIVEEKPLSEGEVIQRQIIENFQRAELLPLERARALKRLIDTTGWQTKEAAAKCGLSNATATKLLALLSLPEPIKRRVDSGEISSSAGYELNRVANPARQAELAQQMAEGRLTRDALSGTVKRDAQHKTKAPARQANRFLAVLSDGRSVTVAGGDLTVEGVIEALEALLAKARRALRRGVDLKGLAALLRQEAKATDTKPRSTDHVAVFPSVESSDCNQDLSTASQTAVPPLDPRHLETGQGSHPVVAQGSVDASQCT